MADRVKYFLLGLLFLVVAGVIAYDRWNTNPADLAAGGDDRGWEVVVGRQSPTQTDPARELSVPSTPEKQEAKPAKKKPVRQPMRLEPPPREPAVQPVIKVKPPKPKVHIIRAGETLESIALHYYKTRKGIQWIVDANKLKNPDRVYEDQKLVIPARKETKRKTPTTETTATTATTSSNKLPADGRYKVKSGDGDLYAICRRFYGSKGEGARVARIMELNHLWSAEVKAGTVLILPKK
jgi:nucleoid-associated protein YgaU